MVTPIFIFSLPRAGSTLLQRILMTHNDIASVSEPWLLLPQIFALRKEGTLSTYSSFTAYNGIKDFIDELPEGEADYNNSLRKFILELYSKQCQNNETYFLDKTPRYYLILDDIMRLFPNAKVIFLFRNPIHVYASIISTWGNNKLRKQHTNYRDIMDGFPKLSQAFIKYRSRCIAVNYEDLIADTNRTTQEILDYLNLEHQSTLASEFTSQSLKGTMGDKTGIKEYNAITDKSLDKWKTVFNSVFRKHIVKKMIRGLDDVDLNTQGYNKNDLLHSLKAVDNKKNYLILSDMFDFYLGRFLKNKHLDLWFNKSFSWIKHNPLS